MCFPLVQLLLSKLCAYFSVLLRIFGYKYKCFSNVVAAKDAFPPWLVAFISTTSYLGCIFANGGILMYEVKDLNFFCVYAKGKCLCFVGHQIFIFHSMVFLRWKAHCWGWDRAVVVFLYSCAKPTWRTKTSLYTAGWGVIQVAVCTFQCI